MVANASSLPCPHPGSTHRGVPRAPRCGTLVLTDSGTRARGRARCLDTCGHVCQLGTSRERERERERERSPPSPTVTPADPIPCRPSDSRPPLQTPPARKLSDFHRMGRSPAERIHCPPAPSRRAGASRRGAAAERQPWRPRKVLFKGNTMNEVEERDREVEEREDERHSDDIGRLLSICNKG